MNDAQLVRGIKASAACWRISTTSATGSAPRRLSSLAERFAFQELHGNVRRAIIRLGRFVNGNDIGVVNATRGTRLILKAQQEVGVIEKFAVQDLERHGAISHPNLLGEENRTHAALCPGGGQGENGGTVQRQAALRSPWLER